MLLSHRVQQDPPRAGSTSKVYYLSVNIEASSLSWTQAAYHLSAKLPWRPTLLACALGQQSSRDLLELWRQTDRDLKKLAILLARMSQEVSDNI